MKNVDKIFTNHHFFIKFSEMNNNSDIGKDIIKKEHFTDFGASTDLGIDL